ncbi:hypothetical protein P280DRAFT_521135 [Massarina eburnea CBS 473.64]|uniref:Uncharacterized protein n=1 Tax=Massarina eburnea CBS 473.64 TaxID=1395130 RepID=A0A6A6RTV5_9PLEO|nr:hypothetical protein P280DRAFT_521135 [Massarina eburnea CBS 473.64]
MPLDMPAEIPRHGRTRSPGVELPTSVNCIKHPITRLLLPKPALEPFEELFPERAYDEYPIDIRPKKEPFIGKFKDPHLCPECGINPVSFYGNGPSEKHPAASFGEEILLNFENHRPYLRWRREERKRQRARSQLDWAWRKRVIEAKLIDHLHHVGDRVEVRLDKKVDRLRGYIKARLAGFGKAAKGA